MSLKRMLSKDVNNNNTYVNKVDKRIVRGSLVRLRFLCEQEAYGCVTAVVVQPGDSKNLYCSLFISKFHQPVYVPYYAIELV